MLYFFDNPQLGAAGSRVLFDFFIAGGDGVARQEFENAAGIPARGRPFGTINPFAALLAEVDLGDPVLKGVECKDSEACTWGEKGGDFK